MRAALHFFGALLSFTASFPLIAAPATAYTVPVAPWTFPNQPDRGVAAEYLHYLFTQAKVPMNFGSLPYARVILGLEDGSNAAAMLIPDAKRDKFALRLCEVGKIRSGLLYKKKRHATLSLQDLPGLTIGMQTGTHALDQLAQMPGIERYKINSIEQGLAMLKMDRLDATFLSSPGSEIMLRANALAQADYGWLEVAQSPVVIYVSRKAALANDEAALQRLRTICAGSARAVMDELMRKYR